MGIKNIHIALIAVATILGIVLGCWALTHQYQLIGVASLISSVGLLVYGVSFVKKAASL